MKINRNQIEKYFNGTASKEEVKNILAWFKSDEGQEYLNNGYEKDLRNLTTLSRSFKHPGKEQTFLHIQSQLAKREKSLRRVQRSKYISSVWIAAASVFFILASIAIVNIYHSSTSSTDAEESVSMTVYSTQDEQKLLTFSDGSRIRLNRNTTMEVPDDFTSDIHSVKLDGEAYFEIAHNPDRIFKVYTEKAAVQVLGTSFNVKTNAKKNIYVSVTGGAVSLSSMDSESDEKVLKQNMLGIYHAQTNAITTENIDVNNYLSWLHGRIIFSRASFSQVIQQLEHIYDFDSIVEDEALYQLELTSNFSEVTMENVLQVIAEGLDIAYEMEGDTIIKWSQKVQAESIR